MKMAESKLGKIDFLLHSIAFADREDLSRPTVETGRSGFKTGHGCERVQFDLGNEFCATAVQSWSFGTGNDLLRRREVRAGV